MLVVLTTAPNEEEANRLAQSIVDSKLAACVQILPKMRSVYFWEGAVQTEPEHLLLIKTLEEKFDTLSEFIKKNHSYHKNYGAMADMYLKHNRVQEAIDAMRRELEINPKQPVRQISGICLSRM